MKKGRCHLSLTASGGNAPAFENGGRIIGVAAAPEFVDLNTIFVSVPPTSMAFNLVPEVSSIVSGNLLAFVSHRWPQP